MTPVDLRSDTVTRPTPAMRAAMAAAEVGDAVLGDDPTVLALEARAAELVGKEAGLFVASGTQSNLVALLTHCGRGDEYVVGQEAHTYKYEGGGAAVLGGIQPQPLDVEADGTLDLDRVAAAVKPLDPHFARTRLLCLEDTQGGRPLPLDYHADAARVARDHGLALHLDGARLWNAAAFHGRPAAELAAPYDTVSVCLSKGLGAPVGSVLCGPADFVAEAARWRKVVGGGLRQAGIVAAGGLYALDHHRDRLVDDHANAARLGRGLAGIDGIEASVHTNMVLVRAPGVDLDALARTTAAAGVLLYVRGPVLRLVTHLDVDAEGVERALEVLSAGLRPSRGRR